MAGRKENLKALFTNTRSRIIIIFTAVLLLIAVLIGVFRFTSTTDVTTGAALTATPGGLRSIPGSADPTAQYAALVEQRNVEQAQQASEKGGSAIPTIIRTQAFGEGVEVVGPQQGEGGVGFATLAMEGSLGPQQELWLQSLKESNCSKSAVDQAVNQGAPLELLKQACTCVQLKDHGFGLAELEPICPCKALKAAGFNVQQLKNAGYSAARLRQCGFNACELKNAGFTAQQMKDAGFSDDELKGAGFSEEAILRAAGLPEGIAAADVRKAGCNPEALQRLRAAGVSAAAIRRISGCSVQQLKAAGFTAQELKNAGFTAADLRKAGFTPAELRQAGYSARDLLNAGFTSDDLASAGFSPAEIRQAESELPPGITIADIKNAGCNPEALRKQRAAGVSAKLIREQAGCSAAALKAAGYTDMELGNAGFTAQQIQAIQPVSDEAVRAAGCNAQQLKALAAKGVSAQRIRELNGCSAEALKAAGYNASDLLNAGFSPQELLNAGFTAAEVNAARKMTAAGAIAAGRAQDCSLAALQAAREAGVSAVAIKQTLGCSAEAMKNAGFSAQELKNAGFTAAELKKAGFTAQDLKNAGFSARALREAGFSANELKSIGYTAAQLKDAGFSASELRAAGFNAEQLKAAGFSAQELKNAGFSAGDLRSAGYSASELREAGFSAAQLTNAGYSAAELSSAGFPPSELAALTAPILPEPPSQVPTIPRGAAPTTTGGEAAANQQRLEDILESQQSQMATQEYQQKLSERQGLMLTAANQALQQWRTVPTQVFIAGTKKEEPVAAVPAGAQRAGAAPALAVTTPGMGGESIVKTGDVMFAVLDTSVNTDEPSPILATIVSGKLKGAKLIGSFTLPANADKMVISFNTMSVPGAPKTTSINAYAIDPNTARTALASYTNHHFLYRYGSLFAATFLEGFGNAFQSANTQVVIGGTGEVQNTTIYNGIGRSVLENAVIGLATLGKHWGQVAQQQFNRPTTVEVCAGTGIGVLFTQDVTSL